MALQLQAPPRHQSRQTVPLRAAPRAPNAVQRIEGSSASPLSLLFFTGKIPQFDKQNNKDGDAILCPLTTPWPALISTEPLHDPISAVSPIVNLT
jgi:hypothetical protein